MVIIVVAAMIIVIGLVATLAIISSFCAKMIIEAYTNMYSMLDNEDAKEEIDNERTE